ncbi:amidohydrolase [Rhodococcus rhodnii]|uniref:Hydroxydechloroatrazine ethylaminohydrolase n=2 Tax=Rhodococcus rhodnii TaxID=38312 RepID=R7WP25_9NOCA|nr:amidohydrolase family protein [Rhodococcus rhodnii]EOM75734.1 hydroxydechloroatrazine ethylaminohydrolase [Rhodococcus rhodnii LMG 5362]TXG89632.1 amidohydrolase [Rhodococcus rhodnii]
MALVVDNADVITMDAVTGSEPVTRSIRIEDGVITEIGATVTVNDGDTVLDGRDRLVTPGLVNAHTHSWEALYKGRYDNLPLELWMLYSYPILGVDPLPEDVVRLRSLLFAIESLESGVTTIVDDVLETPGQSASQLAAVFDAYEQTGIRANVSGHVINRPFIDTLPFVTQWLPDDIVRDVRGQATVTAEEYLDYSRTAFAAHDRSAGGRLRYMLAPSAPQRCTPDLLAGATALAVEYDAECHVHVLETRTQAVTAQVDYGRTFVEYLRDIDALSPNTTFAHGIWLTDSDIDIVAEHGVCVSHNPLSNLKLGSGLAPWRTYHDKGVTLGLGTDGCSSSDTPRLLEVAKSAALVHKITDPDPETWPKVGEVLAAATTGGARSARLGETVGSLEVGKRADFLVYDLTTLAFTPRSRLDHQWVYSENGGSLEYVYVDGRCVVDHGRITTVDRDGILRELREAMPRIAEWQNKLDELNGVLHEPFARMYRESLTHPVPVNRWAG